MPGIGAHTPTGPRPAQLFFAGLSSSFSRGDHLQLAADDHFLEFLEVQDLLLQLALGLLQGRGPPASYSRMSRRMPIGADHLAIGVAQGGGG